MKALHRRQAFELTTRHWHQDVAQLVQTLKRVPGPGAEPRGFFRFARPKQAAQRREAEERAAKEEAEHIAAEDRAKRKPPTSNKRSFLWTLAFLIIVGLIAFVAMRDTSKPKEGTSTASGSSVAEPPPFRLNILQNFIDSEERLSRYKQCLRNCDGNHSYESCIKDCDTRFGTRVPSFEGFR